jgi:hypothetical protein
MNRDRRALMADLDIIVGLGLAEESETGKYKAATNKLAKHVPNRVRRATLPQ